MLCKCDSCILRNSHGHDQSGCTSRICPWHPDFYTSVLFSDERRMYIGRCRIHFPSKEKLGDISSCRQRYGHLFSWVDLHVYIPAKIAQFEAEEVANATEREVFQIAKAKNQIALGAFRAARNAQGARIRAQRRAQKALRSENYSDSCIKASSEMLEAVESALGVRHDNQTNHEALKKLTPFPGFWQRSRAERLNFLKQLKLPSTCKCHGPVEVSGSNFKSVD